MPESSFVAQLEYLRAHYRVLPLDQALDELWSGGITEPTAAITFDDGYRNNLTIGGPLLEKYGLPSTIYLPTGLIGTDARLWTTDVDLAFEHVGVGMADLGMVDLGTVSLASTAERSKVKGLVKQKLKSLTDGERRRNIVEIKHALRADHVDSAGDFAIMSWDEVTRMGSAGLTTFGGHTVNHVILSRATDDGVRAEIGDSVAAVRERAGRVSETFAYPNGRRVDFDRRSQDVLRALGVRAAVTTMEGLNDPDTDRFALRRVAVGDRMTLADFQLRTSGFLPALRERFGRAPDA